MLKSFLKNTFAIDVRSLTAYRISLGFFVLVDLFKRAQDLSAHYSNFGILPLELMPKLPTDYTGWSLHALSGSVSFEALLFAVSAIGAMALALGYKSRPATVLLWLLTVSLQHRNPLVLYGMDDLLRVLLFWSCFLPFDQSAWRLAPSRPTKPQMVNVSSIATAAILIQIASMYFFSGWHKLNTEEWSQGTALQIILNIDELTTTFGQWLQPQTALLRIGTYATVFVECVLPFLLFMPSKRNLWRILALTSLVCLHLSIIVFMHLVLFPYLCLIGLMLFIPTVVWDWLALRWAFLSLGKNANSAVAVDGRPVANGAVIVLIVFCMEWNILDVTNHLADVPNFFRQLGGAFGIDQSWRLFSPPLGDGKWFTIEGTTDSGRTVDAWGEPSAPITFKAPTDFMKHYRNDRWGSYMRGPFDGDWQFLRQPLSSFLCSQWSSKNAEKLKKLKVFLTVHPTLADGKKSAPITTQLWSADCARPFESLGAN